MKSGEIREGTIGMMEEEIRYYENKLNKLKKERETFEEIGGKLDEEDWEVEVSFSPDAFTFDSKDHKESLRVVNKLLLLFPEIEKLKKTFNSSYGRWDWSGYSGNVLIIVNNATPEHNCKPVEQVHWYTSWVCKKKKEVG